MGAFAFDAHYKQVIPILAEGRVVPFLGAGVNCAGRARNGDWSECETDLPDARELAKWLAQWLVRQTELDGVSMDLVRVSQYLEDMLGRGELQHRLRQVLAREAAPTCVHRFLAELPGRLRRAKAENPHLLVVTTNYDDALERAFDDATEPYDTVTYIATGRNTGNFWHFEHGSDEPRLIQLPNEYVGVSPDKSNVILKLHGAVDRDHPEYDSYVITEDNYIEYLADVERGGVLPVTLAAKLQCSHLLFLGYGLRDWNLRVVLRRLWGARELGFTSWAIQLRPDPIDMKAWGKRDVEIYDADLANYIAELETEFDEQL
jgi:hypothetical protein